MPPVFGRSPHLLQRKSQANLIIPAYLLEFVWVGVIRLSITLPVRGKAVENRIALVEELLPRRL